MLKRITTASIVLTFVVSGAAFAATTLTGTKVTLHSTATKGKVLANSAGRTLYLYTPDTKNHSNCYGTCAQAWPPLMTTAKPIAGIGVRPALLGMTRRTNGKLQVTYNGHPLYRYIGDSAAGQTNGEGSGGIWFVLSAAGAKK
jgi:predicted lipoprotein with Yx(FWY)xxD motif